MSGLWREWERGRRREPTPPALPTTGQFFERGNYAPVPDELHRIRPARARVPSPIDGWYLRNGPNPRQPTGHWFTGDGMIHGVRLEGGAAKWYRNRWVRTDSFTDPFPLYNADGTRNLRAAVANTHVVNHARQDAGPGRVVAALRDHQRPGDGRLLRLRRQARTTR